MAFFKAEIQKIVKRGTFGVVSALVIALSFVGYSYLTSFPDVASPQNASALVGPTILSLVFWITLFSSTVAFPLRSAALTAIRAMKSSTRLSLLFPAYLTVHLLVYGILLQSILAVIFGAPGGGYGFGVFLSLSYSYSPHTLFSTLLNLTLNPGLVIFIPPYFGTTLNPFTFFSAIAIGLLVVANISRFLANKNIFKKVAGTAVVPLIGVLAGGSCCLSIPELLIIFSPMISAILLTPLGFIAENLLYYMLPLGVILALKLNFDAMKVSLDAQKGVMPN